MHLYMYMRKKKKKHAKKRVFMVAAAAEVLVATQFAISYRARKTFKTDEI